MNYKPFPQTIKMQILGIKLFNRYVVKELDSEEANRFRQLDDTLQSNYGKGRHTNRNQVFKVHQFVAVYGYPYEDSKHYSGKKWMRGVIRDNCHQKNFLFGVYFADYGFEKTCKKSELRELLPYLGPECVPFQAVNYYLTDIDLKMGVKQNQVMKEIESQFESQQCLVTATVEYKDRTGSYGSLAVGDNCDLAAILIAKQLVTDVHSCRHNSYKFNRVANISKVNKNVTVYPKQLPFHGQVDKRQMPCKCYQIIAYKRLEIERQFQSIEAKQETTPRYQESPPEKFTQSI